MFRCLRNGDVRDIIVDAPAKDVKIPMERFFETRTMLKNVVIQEGAMETYTKAAPDYIDGNGEAVITRDIEALVKGLIQRCAKYKLSPLSVLYHVFMSVDDPEKISGLVHLDTNVDPAQLRSPKMLEFEQAVRYLGPPLSIEMLDPEDFVSVDQGPCAGPIGVHYAIMCKPGALAPMGYRDIRRKSFARIEFVITWADELKTYLPDMENRYYAYKDGEDSGWRL